MPCYAGQVPHFTTRTSTEYTLDAEKEALQRGVVLDIIEHMLTEWPDEHWLPLPPLWVNCQEADWKVKWSGVELGSTEEFIFRLSDETEVPGMNSGA